MVVEFYGGAATRVGVADGAFAQRLTEFNIVIAAQWTDPKRERPTYQFCTQLLGQIDTFSSSGHLLTMTSDVGERTLQAAFGNNYKRMVELKAKYDPTNLFADNQRVQTVPIEPGPLPPSRCGWYGSYRITRILVLNALESELNIERAVDGVEVVVGGIGKLKLYYARTSQSSRPVMASPFVAPVTA